MLTRPTRESGLAIPSETDAADRDVAGEGQGPARSPHSNAAAFAPTRSRSPVSESRHAAASPPPRRALGPTARPVRVSS